MTIADIARLRCDYNMSIYAVLQARNHLPDDDEQQQELKKPVIKLWKSIVKVDHHDDWRRGSLLILRRRFAIWVADLVMPEGCLGQIVDGDKSVEALVAGLEKETMRRAEGRMGIGSW